MSSPKDSAKKPPSSPGAVPEERPTAASTDDQELFFPEDERSPLENEDDHSHTDFDLDAEIEKRLSRRPDAGRIVPAEEAVFPDPEDIRPCYEGEQDHSMSDIDIDAEIEAKLGKAPEEEPEQRSAVPPVPADDALPEKSLEDAAEDALECCEDFQDPEDIRPCYEGEQDHSIPGFDLDAEIESQLKKREAERAALARGAIAADHDDHADIHLEDEPSPMDCEDDHSHVDPAHGEDRAMHPDLAASFAAFQTFQARGDDTAQTDARQDAVPPPATDGHSRFSGGHELPAEDDDAPDAAENADGSLSESGYLPQASVGAPADAATEPVAVDDEDPASLLKDKPLPHIASARTEDAAKAADGETATKSAPEDDADEDEEPDAHASSRVPASGGGHGGGGDDGGDGGDSDEAEDADDQPMSLRDHLRELRKRLLRAFLWMLGGFIVCYPFDQKLFTLLMQPLIKTMPKTSHFIFTNPPEAFFTYLKVAFVAGIFLSSPMVFYQIWAFVAPGLYKEEKVYILPVAFFSAVFFICGGAFCYFIGLPFVFEFFMSYNTGLIQAMPSLKETLSFVLQLLLAFGLVFELPLFIFFLSRLGIVTADMLRRFRRYALLLNVILAAILTPPDVISQCLMAGPLILLYEVSIFIAAIFGRKKPKPEEDGDEEEEYEDGPVSK